MQVLALLAFSVAVMAEMPTYPQRIVGGTVTTIDRYPTVASCLFSSNLVNYTQICVGSILNERSVLTAAHCTYGDTAKNWRFRVGSTYANSGGVVHHVKQIIQHPTFNVAAPADNDFAILRSSTFILFNKNVKPVSIAGNNYILADNQPVRAAGWGLIFEEGPFSEELRHVLMLSVNQDICKRPYASVGIIITDNMLCSGVFNVGGRDQCQQDSGGPLYHNGVLVGVCSFGFGCARAQFPGVNARVSRASTWIRQNA
uniref:Peptidase S1 domain-containing protein n=1 Tax=Heliothis virescens TaxID=7102 RepID=A0A2A4K612_HELVI